MNIFVASFVSNFLNALYETFKFREAGMVFDLSFGGLGINFQEIRAYFKHRGAGEISRL